MTQSLSKVPLSPVVRRILLGNTLSAIGSGMTVPLLIVYLGQVRGLGTGTAGLVVAYMALVSLLLMPATGILVDRWGPRPVLIGGLVVEAFGVALLARVDSAGSAFAVATIVSLGASFTWSPQSALLGRLTSADERQRVFGIQFMLSTSHRPRRSPSCTSLMR
ncbi:MAG: MFS transporter [Actinobacteria bacterium]|nr:MFS transporter [Actinomycetota bacterium]